MKKIFLILMLLLFLLPGLLFPQNYQTINFTMQEGMPDNSVRSIYTDSDGLLWIGTDAGLCCFDGKKFKIYSSDEGFDGNNIWSMAEDGNHAMWFGDYGGGLWKFDGAEFSHFTVDNGIVNNRVRSLYYSKKWKLLFIGTQYGLTVFDGKNFTNFNGKNSSLDYDPYIMGFIEEENVIYGYTFSGENLAFYPETKTLIPRPDSLSYAKGSFVGCFKKSDGNSFLTYRNGLAITNGMDSLHDIRVPVNSPDNKNIGQIFGMTEDRFQNVWLASWEPDPKNPGGLFLYDGEKITKYNKILDKNPRYGWCVHYDAGNRILWFGTLDMGLFMIRESLFEYLDPQDFGLDKFKVNDITFDKKGNLILLNEKNLIIEYSDKASWKVPDKLLFNTYRSCIKKAGIVDERTSDYSSFLKVLLLKKFEFQNDSVLWVMSEPGLFKVNVNDQTVVCYNQQGYGSRDLYFDGKGRLCNVGFWGPYLTYENMELNDEFVKTGENTVMPKDISDFVFLNDEVWMTSWSDGLYRGKDTLFVNYNQSNSSFSNALKAICMDKSGNLIIGANNGLLYFIRPTKDSLTIFKTLDAKDGILGNSINWLKVDNKNQLWAGSNTGLNQIDLNRLMVEDGPVIKTYDKQEGYLFPNVNVSLLDDSGNIWLGTDESLVRINLPLENNPSTSNRKIVLNNYEINGFSILAKTNNSEIDPDKTDVLSDLSYDQNYLHFDFDVINFVNPEKDRFRYFLEGLDGNWSKFSDIRHSTYPHLPPGRYAFKVEGKNLNTGLVYSPLTLEIFVRVPYWRSWWFISCTLIFVASSVWFYFKYRINQTRNAEQKKAQVSKQLAELEMKALLAQMNPHFTFNAINSIQNYILDNDVDKALAYLSDFSKIIRQTLDNASKEFISLKEEIEYIHRYLNLEQMRFDKQFEYKIVQSAEIDEETTLIPPMIVQPYAENAIKHGLRHKNGKGKLVIRFGIIEPNVLSCVIEDNGIGRKASEKINQSIRKNHNGAGMAITKNRIQKLKDVYKSELFNVRVKDLLAANNRARGTRIEIFLPLVHRF